MNDPIDGLVFGVKNDSALLYECVTSLWSQTYPIREVYVIDCSDESYLHSIEGVRHRIRMVPFYCPPHMNKIQQVKYASEAIASRWIQLGTPRAKKVAAISKPIERDWVKSDLRTTISSQDAFLVSFSDLGKYLK